MKTRTIVLLAPLLFAMGCFDDDEGRSVSDCSQCRPDETCVTQTVGGAPCEEIPDGGTECPEDTSFNGSCCELDVAPQFQCWHAPSLDGCKESPTCSCAKRLCSEACELAFGFKDVEEQLCTTASTEQIVCECPGA